MATVRIIITLDDSTVLSDTSANPPDAVLSNAINIIATHEGYTATVTDSDGNPIPNPKSKADFFVDWLRSQGKTKVTLIVADAAANAARQTVLNTPINF